MKAAKEFLTIREVAAFLGYSYGSVRKWVVDKRIKSRRIAKAKKIAYRVPVAEAARVKAEIEKGAWA